MDGLNYHHLLYFWTVAKRGSIAKASGELHLTQPTISEQIRLLESQLGHKLFDRVGRSLVLTKTGHKVYEYAEKIFSLGKELTNSLQGVVEERPATLRLGVDRRLGERTVTKLLEPLVRRKERPILEFRRDALEKLLIMLAGGRLQVVLAADRPSNAANLHPHLLKECGTVFMAPKKWKSAAKFPHALEGEPLLAPPAPLGAQLQDWLRAQGITPKIVANFDSEELMRAFGEQGMGIIPLPDLKESEFANVKVVGRSDTVRSRFYAFTRERRPTDPAITAILKRNAAPHSSRRR